MSSSTDRDASANAQLTGEVVRRGDAGYDAARIGWNQLYSSCPRAIVFCAETQDVVNALTWARHNDTPVRVRSGRHCLEGWNAVDDGLVIDVSPMKSAAIDEACNTATVGAGLNQLEAVTILGRAGFAAPTGTEGSVGLVGATLGGGFGLLSRNFGMASDNLTSAEVVVASAAGGAEVLVADEANNSDLLWALRGAGNGNFGIVTSLTYAIHPLTQTIYLTARWSGLENLSQIFDAWQRTAPHADCRLTSQLEIGREEVALAAVLASGSATEVTGLLAPVLSIGEPAVTTNDASWPENYAAFQIPIADEPANWKFFSQFISEPFPPEAIDIIETFLSNAPHPACNYFTNALGGAVTTGEPRGGSAYAHRDALFYAEPGAGWGVRSQMPVTPDQTAARKAETWVADFGEALAPYVNGAYVNVPNADTPEWEVEYWGANVDRLRMIKAKYDPDNVFGYEQGISVTD
jgi:FAD/FMN-containing dehydrogenase